MNKKWNVSRAGERLIQLAYTMESLTSHLRTAGFEFEANLVKKASQTCDLAGRSIDKK